MLFFPSWFCHFDDDNYVNPPALARLLSRHDPALEWYLGKTSVSEPLQVMDREQRGRRRPVSFWFATGGAGVCLSRALVTRRHAFESGAFERAGEAIRLPDDVTLGFVAEHRLGVRLTRVAGLHSHLEPLGLIPEEQLHQQVLYITYWNKLKMSLLLYICSDLYDTVA